MVLGRDVLAWAKGAKADAMTPEELGEEEELVELEEEDLEEGERNAVWAGEEELSGEASPDEVDAFIEWLEENEPEIHDAVMDFARAVSDQDVRMIEHAKQEFKAATQFLNPEYPPLPPEKREEAGESISKHMREKGHPKEGTPEWKQAVAIGLSEARRGEAS